MPNVLVSGLSASGENPEVQGLKVIIDCPQPWLGLRITWLRTIDDDLQSLNFGVYIKS